MSLLKTFASQVTHHKWWQADQPIVVAVSTGVDSMALLHLLQQLSWQRPQIIVAHVNHQLRSASDDELNYLRHYCQQNQLTLATTTWSVNEHPTTGVEDAARQFRYAFFKRIMKQYRAKVLLTAHHQNDQAETFLMKLMRGGDIEQLTGIQQVRGFAEGKLIRPLLNVKKQTLIQYATAHHIKWYEDQTNQVDDVTRNRVRHHLLPMMESENHKVVDGLSSYADQLASVLSANQELLHQLLVKLRLADGSYDLQSFLQQSHAIQVQLIKRLGMQLEINHPLSNKHAKLIVRILNNQRRPQSHVQINARIELVKSYTKFNIEFSKNCNKKGIKNQQIMVRLNHWYRINDRLMIGVFDHSVVLSNDAKIAMQMYLRNADLPMQIRNWQPGDRLTLKSGGHQKVARILIDQKVPNADRQRALVLTTANGQVLSLLGYKNAVVRKAEHSDAKYHLYRLIIKG